MRLSIVVLVLFASFTHADIFETYLEFDGDDLVHVPHSAEIDVSGDFSIEAWVQPYSLAIGRNPRVLQNGQVFMYYNNEGQEDWAGIGFASEYGWQQVFALGVLVESTWTHLAGVFDGASISIYANGTLVASDSVQGSPHPSSMDLRIGAHNADYDYWIGSLEEVRIWDTARTQAEIADNMYVPLLGDEIGLVAYWRFDEGEGQYAIDTSQNENVGRLGTSEYPDEHDPLWIVEPVAVHSCSWSNLKGLY